MKIALVISSLSAGGAERVMALLANHWAGRGEDVSLITIDSSAADWYPIDMRVSRIGLGLRIDSAGAVAAIANNWRRVAALRSALRLTGATVVLSFGEFTNVQTLIATRFTGVRCVVSERTDPSLHYVGRIWHVLRRIIYPSANALVVQTHALRPWAQSIVGGKRVHVIPNPVRDMRHATEATSAQRTPTVVAAGRLVPAKGFDLLLEAFASASQDRPDWKLVIMGEGPERERLMNRAQELDIADRVSLPGWIAEPGRLLTSAGIFAMSSRYEGFPNALLEAMACGAPSVSFACVGPAEIIENEIDGLLVEVGSAAALARALQRLMNDDELRERLGCNAVKVCHRYALESVIQQWDRVLGSAPSNAGAPLRHSAASQR